MRQVGVGDEVDFGSGRATAGALAGRHTVVAGGVHALEEADAGDVKGEADSKEEEADDLVERRSRVERDRSVPLLRYSYSPEL